MFTGLIRHLGELSSRGSGMLAVRCPDLVPELAAGDSVAVNGACLTVAHLEPDGFKADLLPDTLTSTTLGEMPLKSPLNLETALKAGETFGGHFVQGHVDGTTELAAKKSEADGSWRFEFMLPDWLKPYAIDKGSIAIDGVSLTIQELGDEHFSVAVIPTTYRETALGNIMVGRRVNTEADMLVKSVVHAVHQLGSKNTGLDLAWLKEIGYGD